jgi:hypothetical protein
MPQTYIRTRTKLDHENPTISFRVCLWPHMNTPSAAPTSKSRHAGGLGVQDGDGRNCHVAHKQNGNE